MLLLNSLIVGRVILDHSSMRARVRSSQVYGWKSLALIRQSCANPSLKKVPHIFNRINGRRTCRSVHTVYFLAFYVLSHRTSPAHAGVNDQKHENLTHSISIGPYKYMHPRLNNVLPLKRRFRWSSPHIIRNHIQNKHRERSGSVGECLTEDQGAAGSSLTCVTVLCP